MAEIIRYGAGGVPYVEKVSEEKPKPEQICEQLMSENEKKDEETNG